MIAKLERRVRAMIRRGVLRGSSDEGAQRATVSGLDETPLDQVELVEPYGFTSRTPAGAEVVTLAIGGSAEHHVAIAYDRRTRPAGLADGEVAVYHQGGASVVLKANGDVVITPGDGGVVRVGGEAADGVVALHAEIKSILEDVATMLSAQLTAWSATTLADWPADGAILKAVWTGGGATTVPALVAKIAAAIGSWKGRA